MPKYKKCPRCELNYILEDKEYCDVCLSELNGEIIEDIELDDEDITEELVLCPICKINYIPKDKAKCNDCKEAEEELAELNEAKPIKDENQDDTQDETKDTELDDTDSDAISDEDEPMDDDDLEALKGTETEADFAEEEEDSKPLKSTEELEEEENDDDYIDDFDGESDEYLDPFKTSKKVKIITESMLDDYDNDDEDLPKAKKKKSTKTKPVDTSAPKKRGRPKKNG
ncbi:MAG: hypothetical protein K5765_00575 [Clostridia bacterium]|nr:hypothetical protein [Clostridia bacterium]